MSVSDFITPSFAVKAPRGLKADRVWQRTTFNPSKASPGETLYIPIPKLDEDVVMIPGTFSLRFDLVVSGQVNNYVVNNVTSALVHRLTIKLAGEIIQDTNRYDLYHIYSDCFMPTKVRENMYQEGIQSTALNKLRSGAGDADTSVAANNFLKTVYDRKYRIHLDHAILLNHGVLYPRGLNENLLFELTLASAKEIVVGSDPTKLVYELQNLELEYEILKSESLAMETNAMYKAGKMYFYDNVTLLKTCTVARNTDSVINHTVDIPRRSMKGILLLYLETYADGARDSEKFANPDIESVKVTIDGMPNKLFSQGLEPKDLWEEASRFFLNTSHNEKNQSIMESDSDMNIVKFYTSDRFSLFIDLRSLKDNNLHGTGLKLENTKGGVQIEIKRRTSGSGNYTCFIFVIADAQISLLNGTLNSVQY